MDEPDIEKILSGEFATRSSPEGGGRRRTGGRPPRRQHSRPPRRQHSRPPRRQHSRQHRRQHRRGRRSPALAFLLAVALLIVVGVGATGYVLLHDYISPPDYTGEGSGSAVIHVQEGDTATAVSETLEKADVVKSAGAFIDAVQDANAAREITPGYYRLHRHMAASLAVKALLDPSSRLRARVTIPEGTRLSEILSIVAKRADMSKSHVRSAARHPGKLGLPSYAHGLEGYLFPATYDVEPHATARGVLRAMVSRFKQAADDVHLVKRSRDRQLSPRETVTIASLVQAEARRPADFRKVAAVIYNRLDQGKKLQLDATVNYALGHDTLRVSKKDLGVRSPYNTYRHPGLPPGPIDSPGEHALRAALHPAQGDWLWFVTVDPDKGTTKFTSSYQKFLKLKREFKRNTH
ncbi:MAG: endolytic transglycosylase MltG [Streptosporangiaceae bacterium]